MKYYFKLRRTLASVVLAWQWAGVYIIDCYLVFAAECWLIRNGVLSLIFFLPMREPSVPNPAQPSPAQPSPASPATMHKLYSQVSNTKYVTQREGTRCRNLLDYSILPFLLPPPKFWCVSTKINDHDTNIMHSSQYQCHNWGTLRWCWTWQ